MTGGQSVGQSGRDSRLPERVAQACAAVAIAIALLALTGWATGHLILASFHTDFIPMSPATALAFLVLGGALLVGDRQGAQARSWWLACAAAALVVLIGLLILGQHLTTTDLGFEHWLSQSSATFGQVPIGRMSPLAAGTFVAGSLALLTLLASPSSWRLAHEASASAAVGVMVVGVLVALGYWREIAFLSGGDLIPMALPTALDFVFLGGGILAAGGPRVWTMRDYRPAVVGFTVGVVVSILLFALANWAEREHIRAELEPKANAFALTFRVMLRNDTEDLENIRALYAIFRIVDRDAFHTFVSHILTRHPNIQAFSWSPYVTDRERAGYEARARRDGIPAYQFTERSSDGRLVPAQRRPEYVPVFYQEPYAGNEVSLGFDNLSNPVRRATLEKARDTGQAVATDPISLVQGARQGVGVLIYQPVYRAGRAIDTPAQRRADLLGFVVEVLRLGRMIRLAFPNLEREGLEYRLVDATAMPREIPIVASAGVVKAERAGFRFDNWIEVADHRWRLEVYTAPWYLAAKQSGQAWLVLGTGLLLTVILGTYLLASARHTTEVERLSENLRKISQAIEYSPAAVVIADATGAIEYVNPKFTQLTGYDAEEVRGQNPRILKSGETSPEEYQRLWATITSGGEWRGEFHNKKKNGDLFWETASISPVRGLDGHITHFVAIKEDITGRKRNEEVARKRALQLEAVRAVSIEITRELDLTAILHLITERVIELVGGGQGVIRLWDGDSQTLVQKTFMGSSLNQNSAPLRLGEGVAGTAAQRRQGIIVNDFRTSPYAIPHLLDGTSHTAVLAEPLLYGDRLVGVLSILREAGQQAFTEEDQQILAIFASSAAIAIENARLHEEVIQHAETLEARVRERTTELARTNLELTAALRQAEAGNQAKNDFLINMSHELRTPLNAVLGFAQLLQEQAKGGLTDKQRRYLDNIYNSGRHLLALVNEILDLNTAEEGLLTLHLSKVNLADVILEALDATREAARRKGHAVHALIPPDLPLFDADRDRIRQIAICLLSNAVKFTPDGGRITVAARKVDQSSGGIVDQNNLVHQSTSSPVHTESSWVELSVTDTGIGIRAEDLPRLFRMFGQLESPLTKRYEGTGVGLVLAKRLVALHGGTITASSEGEGKGSTFTVRLPIAPAGVARAEGSKQ